MGLSAQYGPLWIFGGRTTLGAGAIGNPDAGPSAFFGGTGIVDPRVGYNVGPLGGVMWYGGNDVIAVDQVPSAISTTAIAAAQVPVAGTPMTLVSATGAGITVLATALYVYGSGNTVPVGALAIDGAPGIVNLGTVLPSTGVARGKAYDPSKSIARAVALHSVGADTGATFTVAGYDLYGYPMTETITGAGTGLTVTGKKAFKFVTSITPAGTLSGSNVSAGQSDVYGLPILANTFGAYTQFYWASAGITAVTGFVAADTTSPATSTTGDPRGTYLIQGTASDGTRRLQMVITPAVANSLTSVGLFGVTPA